MPLFTTYFLTSMNSGSVKMTTCNFVCAFITVVCFNVVLAAGDHSAEDYEDQNTKVRPVGRSYSLTSCDYKTQVGYSCLTCNRALHCYPGNAAILVDCYGFFRFCRDGRCSRFQEEKCLTGNKVTTPDPFNSTPSTEITDNTPGSSKATTKIETSPVTESVTETEKDSVPTTLTTTVTENVATTVSKNVTESVATAVTETVIIPIDVTATTNGDSSSTSTDLSSNVV